MQYLNFSWLLEGSLAGAQGPTNRRDLMFLKLRDIAAVVRMEEETISAEALELVDLYEPVPDFTAPSMEQLDRMCLFIDQQIESWEHPVVVTCKAGIGRTGTVLACYLVYVGYTPENAINFVRAQRPGSIQNREQEEAVAQYYEHVQAQEQERREIRARRMLGGL